MRIRIFLDKDRIKIESKGTEEETWVYEEDLEEFYIYPSWMDIEDVVIDIGFGSINIPRERLLKELKLYEQKYKEWKGIDAIDKVKRLVEKGRLLPRKRMEQFLLDLETIKKRVRESEG